MAKPSSLPSGSIVGMGQALRNLLCAALLIPNLLAQQRPPRGIPSRPEIVPPEVLNDVDALRADPTHYELEFENDQVRVLRLTLKTDEATVTHDAKDALFVCIKECHVRLMRTGRSIQDVHIEAGKTRWLFGDTRSEKNLDSQPLEVLIIEARVRPASN